jgi:hypothetical protein
VTEIAPKGLEPLWSAVSAEPPSGGLCRARRVDAGGPISVFAGIRNTDGARAILFEMASAHAPHSRFRFHTEGISLVRDRGGDGEIELVGLVAIDPAINPLFAVLASDIAGHVLAGPPSSAGARLQARLLEWREALKARREILSREAVLGLWGELHLLRQIADEVDAQAAVASWAGPEGGLHDFAANGFAIECKTQSGGDTAIQISSLDQLQCPAAVRLALVRVRVVESQDGMSLTQSIAATRAVAYGWELERKLALAGWRDQDAELHDGPKFTLIDQTQFDVAAGFPALTRDNTPAGIVDGRYRIDPKAAEPFRIDAATFAQLVTALGGMLGPGA